MRPILMPSVAADHSGRIRPGSDQHPGLGNLAPAPHNDRDHEAPSPDSSSRFPFARLCRDISGQPLAGGIGGIEDPVLNARGAKGFEGYVEHGGGDAEGKDPSHPATGDLAEGTGGNCHEQPDIAAEEIADLGGVEIPTDTPWAVDWIEAKQGLGDFPDIDSSGGHMENGAGGGV